MLCKAFSASKKALFFEKKIFPTRTKYLAESLTFKKAIDKLNTLLKLKKTITQMSNEFKILSQSLQSGSKKVGIFTAI